MCDNNEDLVYGAVPNITLEEEMAEALHTPTLHELLDDPSFEERVVEYIDGLVELEQSIDYPAAEYVVLKEMANSNGLSDEFKDNVPDPRDDPNGFGAFRFGQ